MKYMKKLSVFVLSFLYIFSFQSCVKDTPFNLVKYQGQTLEYHSRTPLEQWSDLDIERDTIPGTSWNRALELIEQRNIQCTPIIVAILDSPIDIQNTEIAKQLWVNKGEIPNDSIDNDNNGYIDDVHGWNFRGNAEVAYSPYAHYEFMRIINTYEPLIQNNTLKTIEADSSEIFKQYYEAKKAAADLMSSQKNQKSYLDMINNVVLEHRTNLSDFLKGEDYTIDNLQEILKNQDQDSLILKSATILKGFIENGYTQANIDELNAEFLTVEKLLASSSENDRKIQGDDPADLNDTSYGNNKVGAALDIATHGTRVVGTVVSSTPQLLEQQIKIMPVIISGDGENSDKDIALGIRYAVDNGAKIINMSFGKELSMNKKWVDDAILYAENNNVLIVTSAGNGNSNLDHTSKSNFPNDIESGGKLSSNFIKVGASSYHLTNRLKPWFSNYGTVEVDLFAPGDSIYTFLPKNSYKWDSGTSIASAQVCKVAALLWSTQPSLSVKELKKILLESAVKYNIEVQANSENDTLNTRSFEKISRSGGIVNAYNALLSSSLDKE